ncbi:hypothetical protein QFZ98_000789 [Paraburkholderia youngii]
MSGERDRPEYTAAFFANSPKSGSKRGFETWISLKLVAEFAVIQQRPRYHWLTRYYQRRYFCATVSDLCENHGFWRYHRCSMRRTPTARAGADRTKANRRTAVKIQMPRICARSKGLSAQRCYSCARCRSRRIKHAVVNRLLSDKSRASARGCARHYCSVVFLSAFRRELHRDLYRLAYRGFGVTFCLARCAF